MLSIIIVIVNFNTSVHVTNVKERNQPFSSEFYCGYQCTSSGGESNFIFLNDEYTHKELNRSRKIRSVGALHRLFPSCSTFGTMAMDNGPTIRFVTITKTGKNYSTCFCGFIFLILFSAPSCTCKRVIGYGW